MQLERYTHHFSLTINKTPQLSVSKLIPGLSTAFQVSGNPVNAITFFKVTR